MCVLAKALRASARDWELSISPPSIFSHSISPPSISSPSIFEEILAKKYENFEILFCSLLLEYWSDRAKLFFRYARSFIWATKQQKRRKWKREKEKKEEKIAALVTLDPLDRIGWNFARSKLRFRRCQKTRFQGRTRRGIKDMGVLK